jgi:hypothetical protein
MWKLTLGHGNIINMLDTYVVIFVVKSTVMYSKLYHICKSLVTIFMNHKYTHLIFFLKVLQCVMHLVIMF